jgi:lycopene cyclase domain-containing protein
MEVLLAGIVFFPGRIYTLTTGVLLFAFFVYAVYVKRYPWMGAFFINYAIMLLPFLVVNGLLTGSWIGAPVVWYSADGFSGLRLLTIPVEDIFYGMLLIGLTTMVYEWRRKSGGP